MKICWLLIRSLRSGIKKSRKTSFVSSRVFYLITIHQSILVNALTCFVRYMKDGLADHISTKWNDDATSIPYLSQIFFFHLITCCSSPSLFTYVALLLAYIFLCRLLYNVLKDQSRLRLGPVATGLNQSPRKPVKTSC